MEVWTVEIGGLTRMALSEGLFRMFFAPQGAVEAQGFNLVSTLGTIQQSGSP
jgi:hypothetical protein